MHITKFRLNALGQWFSTGSVLAKLVNPTMNCVDCVRCRKICTGTSRLTYLFGAQFLSHFYAYPHHMSKQSVKVTHTQVLCKKPTRKDGMAGEICENRAPNTLFRMKCPKQQERMQCDEQKFTYRNLQRYKIVVFCSIVVVLLTIFFLRV